jgi:hypothetical protein
LIAFARNSAGRTEVADDHRDNNCIASDTVAELDMFDAEDLAFTSETVHAVQISWRAKQDDSASREGPVQDQVGCRDGRWRHAHADLRRL